MVSTECNVRIYSFITKCNQQNGNCQVYWQYLNKRHGCIAKISNFNRKGKCQFVFATSKYNLMKFKTHCFPLMATKHDIRILLGRTTLVKLQNRHEVLLTKNEVSTYCMQSRTANHHGSTVKSETHQLQNPTREASAKPFFPPHFNQATIKLLRRRKKLKCGAEMPTARRERPKVDGEAAALREQARSWTLAMRKMSTITEAAQSPEKFDLFRS